MDREFLAYQAARGSVHVIYCLKGVRIGPVIQLSDLIPSHSNDDTGMAGAISAWDH